MGTPKTRPFLNRNRLFGNGRSFWVLSIICRGEGLTFYIRIGLRGTMNHNEANVLIIIGQGRVQIVQAATCCPTQAENASSFRLVWDSKGETEHVVPSNSCRIRLVLNMVSMLVILVGVLREAQHFTAVRFDKEQRKQIAWGCVFSGPAPPIFWGATKFKMTHVTYPC